MTNKIIVLLNVIYAGIYSFAMYTQPDTVLMVLVASSVSLIFSILSIVVPAMPEKKD